MRGESSADPDGGPTDPDASTTTTGERALVAASLAFLVGVATVTRTTVAHLLVIPGYPLVVGVLTVTRGWGTRVDRVGFAAMLGSMIAVLAATAEFVDESILLPSAAVFVGLSVWLPLRTIRLALFGDRTADTVTSSIRSRTPGHWTLRAVSLGSVCLGTLVSLLLFAGLVWQHTDPPGPGSILIFVPLLLVPIVVVLHATVVCWLGVAAASRGELTRYRTVEAAVGGLVVGSVLVGVGPGRLLGVLGAACAALFLVSMVALPPITVAVLYFEREPSLAIATRERSRGR